MSLSVEEGGRCLSLFGCPLFSNLKITERKVRKRPTDKPNNCQRLIFIALEIFTRKSRFSAAKVACGMCRMWARAVYKSCTGGTSCPRQISPSPAS